jgi:hypothetical protein
MMDWSEMILKMLFLKGRIDKKLAEDMRGTRYRIEGSAKDGRPVHVICRFKEDGNLIILNPERTNLK